jgi:hypothetical protein
MKIKMFVFLFVLVFLFSSTMALGQVQRTVTQKPVITLKRLPDLQVKFKCPTTIVAGTNIGSQIQLKVWNSGKAPAAGTDTAGNNGYMVDLMLSTDTNTPAGWAIYSANFSEDVLLQGGRISNTKTLNPGQSQMYPVGGGIPADTPPGVYYICAKVDAGNKIAELNETNNSFCVRVSIKSGQTKRLPDLQVKFSCPNTIMAGTDIGPQVKLKVGNFGSAPAAGTDTAGNNGYMVDLMLSTDTNTPAGWAIYSANFSEDVLLKGGRISNTKTLNPGQSQMYPVGGGIPADTPSGTYYICAKVDAGNKITESNEGNNSFCKRVYIKNRGGK